MGTSTDRFSNQRVVLTNGEVLKGKNVRIISGERFAELGASKFSHIHATVGDVRVQGFEIPVFRLSGRGGWRQDGPGTSYNASGFHVTVRFDL